jgi:hypothetical protein
MELEQTGGIYLPGHSEKRIKISYPRIIYTDSYGNYSCGSTFGFSSCWSLQNLQNNANPIVQMSYREISLYLPDRCDYSFLEGLIYYNLEFIYKRAIDHPDLSFFGGYLYNAFQSLSVTSKELVQSFFSQQFGTTDPDAILKIIKSRGILDFTEEITPADIMESLFEIIGLKFRDALEKNLKRYFIDCAQNYLASTTNNVLDLKDYSLSTIIINNK